MVDICKKIQAERIKCGYPPGYAGADGCLYYTDEEYLLFIDLRMKEIEAEARLTLGERAWGLLREDCLRLFYSEMRRDKLSAISTDQNVVEAETWG